MELKTIHFPSIDSTNKWVKENAHLVKKNQVTLVTADKQTMGYGRFNRKWVSPEEGNIYATFILESSSFTIASHLTQLLAVTIVQTLIFQELTPKIHWPNDIYLNDKKIGGILGETIAGGLALGFGLNVNIPSEQLQNLDRPATSLLSESGKFWDSKKIIKEITERFLDNLSLYKEDGFSSFLSEFKKNDALLGTILTLNQGNASWTGNYIDLNEDGSITLKLTSGENKSFYSGEVSTKKVGNR